MPDKANATDYKLSLRYTFNSVNTSFRDAQINKSSDGRVD